MKKHIIFLTILTCIFKLLCFNSTCIAQGKVLELKFSNDLPPMKDSQYIDWGKKIESRTNGRVKIKFYWSGSLVKNKELRRATVKGITDLSFHPLGAESSAYSLNSVIELPALGFANEEVATRIWGEIIEKFPEVRAEYKGMKLLWQAALLPHLIHTKNDMIKSSEDLKGLKICAFGSHAKVIEQLGATPITITPFEVYMALERGLADGWFAPFQALPMLRGMKLLNYHNSTKFNMNGSITVMNMRVWKNLPPDIKKVFEDLIPGGQKADLDRVMSDDMKAYKEAERLGHTIITNTPQELKIWEEKVMPLHEKWIAKREAMGLPAREVYNEVRKLVRKYN